MANKQDILNCWSGLSERDLNYFAGHSAFLRLFHSASGADRDTLIQAICEIIETSDDAGIVADLIQLATCLDITQIYPSVDRLKDSGRFTGNTGIEEMIAYNVGIRQLRSP